MVHGFHGEVPVHERLYAEAAGKVVENRTNKICETLNNMLNLLVDDN